MTTWGPTNVAANITADADFRAFCQGIHNALLGVGCLVQTADTGQINTSTVTRPGTSTAAGYEIFRFNDALQATAPIFVKIEYGVGAAVDRPALWITTGGSTNGAGTIAGSSGGGGRLGVATTLIAKAAGSFLPAVASGDGGRFSLAFHMEAGSVMSFAMTVYFLGVERTRDSTGAYTADGWVTVGVSNNTGGAAASYVAASSSSAYSFGPCVPAAMVGVDIVGANGPAFGTMVYYLGKPFYGLSWGQINDNGCPGLGAVFSANVLGATHSYMQLAPEVNQQVALSYGGANDTKSSPCMLWE